MMHALRVVVVCARTLAAAAGVAALAALEAGAAVTAVTAATIAAAPAQAQLPPAAAPQRAAVLRGLVLEDATDAPLYGAEVAIPNLGISALSDSAGKFRLPAIAPGRHIVWVRKLGFAPVSTLLAFAEGDTLEREFALVRNVQALPEVEVTAPAPVRGKLAEFDERRRAGFGHFITQTDLDKHEDRRLSEVMATIPGTRVVRGNTNAAWIMTGRGIQSVTTGFSPSSIDRAKGAPRGCYAAVVLDGIFVFQGFSGEALWDINSLDPRSIAGIEVYNGAATIPTKYAGTRNTCGLVMIWTRI